MKKLMISLVLEGNEEIIDEIKSNIMQNASTVIKECKINEVEEKPFELDLPAFVSVPHKPKKVTIIDLLSHSGRGLH